MQSTSGKRVLHWAGLLALVAALFAPSPAGAVPEPGAKGRGFRLFARSLGALTVNRVYCGLNSTGQVCVDSTGSSTIGGGFWPKGTADQYIFNSGLQLAGIVGPDGGDWAGDTTGAFFFDPKGTTEHGVEITPIYNSQNPEDAAAWPEAARVPTTGASSDFYDNLLRGRTAASQGDIWFLTWEGDPSANAGRPHPLGVLVEVRGIGWNYPRFNNDILYFVYTFYNVTSTDPADYATARPEIQQQLLDAATQFQARNNAAFGISLPAGGYTINNLYAAFARDDDVASAGSNYSSVNLPFALGYTYEHTFYGPNATGWTFSDAIFSGSFFKGPGFTGAKYLASPTGVGEIQLFSNTINGGDFGDPQNTTQLYRYLSGNISTAAGDEDCSYNPVTDRVCFVNNGTEDDMRFFQSSTALTLGPGESGSIVVAYIHAAPVALPGFTGAPGADIKPGDPRGLGDAIAMEASINRIDSLTGYLGFNDGDADLNVTQDEFVVVAGSLLGKSLVAQTIFNNKFLLPFSPEVPEFFLVPGNNEVTVFWQPSATDNLGDPFYQISKDAVNPDLTVNAIYDANYREFDVEGYRVYRGRVDSPDELTLLGQFDKTGTVFSDFYGTVNASGRCAPEILDVANPGIPVEDDCAVDFDDVLTPGIQLAAHADYPISGSLVQVTERVQLADASVLITASDSAVIGSESGANPDLTDTGIPFVFVDNGVRNGFRYFYSVTAFDVNSIRSGPSSLESARITKPVTPSKDAANYDLAGTITGAQLVGRGVVLNQNAPNATIDPTNGTFSGPAPPANAWTVGFGDFVARVLSEPGAFSARLDSIAIGSPYSPTPVPHVYWYSVPATGTTFSVPIVQQQEIGVRSGSAQFAAVELDEDLAELYGGGAGYSLQGKVTMQMDGADYTSLYGRGCVNSRAGFAVAGAGACAFNGSRWFDGPSPTTNETFAHPIGGNGPNFVSVGMTVPNNAGSLTGVLNIHNSQSYQQLGGGGYRGVEGMKSGAKRAADFNVYWGAGGLIDSVIDVTHNVPLAFDSAKAGGGWGILNASETPPGPVGDQSWDRRAELTNSDMGCVEPFRSYRAAANGNNICGAEPGLTAPKYIFSRTAIPGPVVMPITAHANDVSPYRTAPAQPNNGFLLYVAGDFMTFELAGGAVPASGTVWSLRQYIGAIAGGRNNTGSIDYGPYIFTPSTLRTMSAVGAELQVTYEVSNTLRLATNDDLSNVHTVPDPYYVTNQYEQTTETKIIKFVNLPQEAIIRIYSASGVLVRVIEHQSSTFSGEATWDVRNRSNQVVASGVYFYHIESGDARKVGRFTVVNFAQ